MAANHRPRLVDAAAALFAEHGYQQVSVGDIVAAAHTSRTTFYEHFTDRTASYNACIADTILTPLASNSDIRTILATHGRLLLPENAPMHNLACRELISDVRRAITKTSPSAKTETADRGRMAWQAIIDHLRGDIPWQVAKRHLPLSLKAA